MPNGKRFRVTHSAYSFQITDVTGEQEVVVVTSPGQSGHVAYCIVFAAADGGLQVVRNVTYGTEATDVASANILQYVQSHFPTFDTEDLPTQWRALFSMTTQDRSDRRENIRANVSDDQTYSPRTRID